MCGAFLEAVDKSSIFDARNELTRMTWGAGCVWRLLVKCGGGRWVRCGGEVTCGGG